MVIPPKPPERFFPVGSAVLDFPYGNINPVTNLLVKEEIIFMMYYAPWCSKSKEIRTEFAIAAKYFQNRVRFVAVNCWWPNGECRSSYKLISYPELFIYHTNLDGFKFTGIPTAAYMIKYTEDILYPLKILHTREQIKEFNSRYDNVMIGFFDFHASPQPLGYRQFYITAMRLLEEDFSQPVRTAIITQPNLASLLGLHNTKSLILHRLTNTTLIYPQNNNFTDEDITQWIRLHKQQPVVKWLSPPGHKTQHLSTAINRGSAVLVFIPINQLHTYNYYYNMVREVALHYLNCNNSLFLHDAVELSIRQRSASLEGHLQQTDQCRHKQVYKSMLYMPPSHDKNCCVSLVTSHSKEYSGEDSQTVCEYCKHVKTTPSLEERSHLCMIDTPTSLSAGVMLSGLAHTPPQCLNTAQDYNTNEYRTLCCKECSYNMLSDDKCSSRKTTDPFIAKSNSIFQNLLCRNLKLQEEQNLTSPFDFIKDFDRLGIEEVIGLHCRSNRTLNLHVMDIKHHSVFLERLVPGYPIDINTPAAVIVDKKNEAQFVLGETFNKKNLAQFIINYTSSDLNRHLRSGTLQDPCYGENAGVCIRETTFNTFQDIILQQDKDVLVLLYAPWCGFCAGFAHLYINLAKYFKTAQNLIFARINADTNDLPWEYTVSSYPTLLFFPAHRKSDSVVFPASIPKTLPNLIKFVLHHSTHDLRLDTAADICSNSCIDHNRVVVAATIETLRMRSHQYTRRLRRLMSRLASLNNTPSPNHHLTKMSKHSPEKSSSDRLVQDPPDDDLVLHRRHKVHSSIAYVQRQIHKMEKRVKDAMHLHKYLLSHKKFTSGKEQLFKYFSPEIKDTKSKTKS
ncbi:thioredoxin domain-containing protein 11-like [Mizuhopecten yessoensis]|uniref:Thioredoxin domain-containing protein 11 n=1 Tax=Mizuhopecten yessoensis TaxID=6573 RepID=A0A210QXC3_MIZYE|nr:thioredoxin domain-containing protein 11-like [Mizuhopecten yessoensis]OWF53332.1 Thioredoxin domain-containing protein 11 [Mizuhopecten yessoensis]